MRSRAATARVADDRDELPRDDEERPPHREHAHQAAVLVERAFDVRHGGVRPRDDGEEHGDGIGRMEDAHGACGVGRRRATPPGVEQLPTHESRSPLCVVDPPHAH
jgi:hypothetical protein